MDAAKRVLEVLYDRAERFVPLDELASSAGAGPEEVAAAVAELRRLGQRIEQLPPHGVRLPRPVRLDARLIERRLGTRRVGRSVLCFDEVDSTNDVAMDSARSARSDGLVVLAECQRKGRGRMGRRWHSPAGANILMSVVLLDDAGSLSHEALTVATGLAAAQGVEDSCSLACDLRWPNDVLLNGAKAAGVLVEVRTGEGRRCVVLGVGINANAAPPAEQVETPATCLADHLGHPVERVEVVRSVLRRLDGWVARIAEGRLGELREAWLSFCGMLHERVAAVSEGRRYVGTVLDVSPLEGLTLGLDDETRVHLPAVSTTIQSQGSQ
jgi:BirA family biotin operon repressor/biotin-[acetyl-CoA-carboxylase] ligase